MMKSSTKTLKSASLRGIKNYQNSCYINCNLFALFNLHSFLVEKCHPVPQNDCLYCILKESKKKLFKKGKEAISIDDLIIFLPQLSISFSPAEQSDSHEFLMALLENLEQRNKVLTFKLTKESRLFCEKCSYSVISSEEWNCLSIVLF